MPESGEMPRDSPAAGERPESLQPRRPGRASFRAPRGTSFRAAGTGESQPQPRRIQSGFKPMLGRTESSVCSVFYLFSEIPNAQSSGCCQLGANLPPPSAPHLLHPGHLEAFLVVATGKSCWHPVFRGQECG